MDTLQTALLPLGAFWATFSSLQSAAAFTNELRETIVTGHKAGKALTAAHRRTIFLDWSLSMVAAIGAAFTFGGIILWISFHIRPDPALARAAPILMTISLFPLLAGAFLIVCGISDFRLIRRTLRQAEEEEERSAAPRRPAEST